MSQSLLAENTDFYRVDANAKLDKNKRSDLGQFMTIAPISRFMASLFNEYKGKEISLLDPGAGVGSLSVSFIEEFLSRESQLKQIEVTSYEIDQVLLGYLENTMENLKGFCTKFGVDSSAFIKSDDFIMDGVLSLLNQRPKSRAKEGEYTHVIMNPPYKKISSLSNHRKELSAVGIEVTNLYAAFLAIAVEQLKPGGEVVAIVPRSFCNGPYFKSFREFFLSKMSIEHLHIFDCRESAFKADKVLQENIIIHAVKRKQIKDVVITSTPKPNFLKNIHLGKATSENTTYRIVPFTSVVMKDDPRLFIHIASTNSDQETLDRVSVFKQSLSDIGLEVSTGPVVDFRLKECLVKDPEPDSVPLLYPTHFQKNKLQWPKESKKPNAIRVTAHSKKLLWDNKGSYVVVRRFTSKEERRRLVASVYEGSLPGDVIGFENHLNIIHSGKFGVENDLAKGVAVYLNSTLLDKYFRQFSGHTQVNATDLRFLKYPSKGSLIKMGQKVGVELLDQNRIDEILEEVINFKI